MYLNLGKNIAKAGRSTRSTDQWTRHTKRLGYEKWRSDDLGVGGLRYLDIVSPSSAMPSLARTILPNMIVLYILTAIEGDQGNWRSWRVLYDYAHARQDLERTTHKFRETATERCVSYMKIMPSGNSSQCTSYVPIIVTMDTGKDFHDHGGGHIRHHHCYYRNRDGLPRPRGWSIVEKWHLWADNEDRITFRLVGANVLLYLVDNVHRDFQRLTTNKRGHRQENKPTRKPHK